MAEFGFEEIPDHRQFPNPFAVCYSNHTTEVCIEGTSWGAGIQVMLINLAAAPGSPREIPLWVIVQLRTRQEGGAISGQLRLLARDAALLREHAHDVLRGDFAIFPEADALMMRIHEENLKPRQSFWP